MAVLAYDDPSMAEDGPDYTVRQQFPARTKKCARFHAAGEVSRHRPAATPGYHRPPQRTTGACRIAVSTIAGVAWSRLAQS
jgi:hypothetical protein